MGEQETRGIQSEPMPRGIKAKILSSSAKKTLTTPSVPSLKKVLFNFQKLTSAKGQTTRGIQSERMPRGKK